MHGTGAVTPEAQSLNAGAGHFVSQAELQEERDEWRELMQLLPDGQVPDAETLALVIREEPTWAPLRRVRQRLVEMGAANGGQGLIAHPSRVAELREQLRAKRS